MDALLASPTPVPVFLRNRRIHFSIDTSGYCQARCALCVWPELENRKRMMKVEEFAALLANLDGYSFSEFGLNSINEPFSDATILDKMQMVIESGLEMDALFFSSNWLAASPEKITRFAQLVAQAERTPSIKAVSINATVSGIDEDSYDVLQAGRDLTDVKARYRPLSFAEARAKVVHLVRELDRLVPPKTRVTLRIKAYGYLFDQAQYEAYWRKTLADEGVGPTGVHRVKFIVNHGLTSFARSEPQPGRAGLCRGGWLDRGLVVGPDGRLALCCHEGGHKVQLKSLVEHSLEEIVASPDFRFQQSIALGLTPAPDDHPCTSCEFYDPLETAADAPSAA